MNVRNCLKYPVLPIASRVIRCLFFASLLFFTLHYSGNSSFIAAQVNAADDSEAEEIEPKPIPFTDVEFGYLSTMLKAIGMTRSDLGFEKKWATDAGRLSIVNHLMDDPLLLPNYTHDTGNAIARGKRDPASTILWMADEIDRAEDRADWRYFTDVLVEYDNEPSYLHSNGFNSLTESPNEEYGNLPDGFDPSLRLMESLYLATREFWGELEMSKQEYASLLYSLPSIWIDEEDEKYIDIPGWREVLLESAGWKQDDAVIIELDSPEIIRWGEEVAGEAEMCFSSLVAGMVTRLTDELKIVDFSGYSSLHHPDFPGLEVFFASPKTSIGGAGDSTNLGLSLIIGTTGDDIYPEGLEFDFLIDPGGNDIYLGRAGGSPIDSSNISTGRDGEVVFQPGIQVVIDLAGDDRYISDEPYSQGSGVLGTGILVDFEGDDYYKANLYSQGSAVMGFGWLWDMAGDDTYESDLHSQGAATFGIALHQDDGGNDHYLGRRYCQGFGGPRAYGLLADHAGNDLYYCTGQYLHAPLYDDYWQSLGQGFGFGWRGEYSGGIGCLFDESGNDFYSGEIYAQGSSYWYALGMLIDRSGNDHYSAIHYSQGAGIHLSVGQLLDYEGDDHYDSPAGPSQGCAHDLAVGMLVDLAGDDYYTANGVGQGTGHTNAVGLLYDRQGKDSYMGRSPQHTQGAATFTRGFGSIGLFLDLGGADVYSPGGGTNGELWTKGTWGAGLDVALYE